MPTLDEATESARAALAGFRAAPAWPAAPRPVAAGDLLPERALAGDAEARRTLRQEVYGALVRAGGELLETLDAFFAAGGVLESAARALYVHPNTVRYRLRRVGRGDRPHRRPAPGRVRPAGGARPIGRLDRARSSAPRRPAGAPEHTGVTEPTLYCRIPTKSSGRDSVPAGHVSDPPVPGTVITVLAVLSPGQGAQKPGFLDPVAGADPAPRPGCAGGPRWPGWTWCTWAPTADAEEIKDTAKTQPLLVAAALLGRRTALADVAAERSVVAGHSVGELGAAALAGVLTAETAVTLAGVARPGDGRRLRPGADRHGRRARRRRGRRCSPRSRRTGCTRPTATEPGRSSPPGPPTGWRSSRRTRRRRPG